MICCINQEVQAAYLQSQTNDERRVLDSDPYLNTNVKGLVKRNDYLSDESDEDSSDESGSNYDSNEDIPDDSDEIYAGTSQPPPNLAKRWAWWWDSSSEEDSDENDCEELLEDISDECEENCDTDDDDYNQLQCDQCCATLCQRHPQGCKKCCPNHRQTTFVPQLTTRRSPTTFRTKPPQKETTEGSGNDIGIQA